MFVCVGGSGRDSLAMNLSMQAMAGCYGAWGWTCAFCVIVRPWLVQLCFVIPINRSNTQQKTLPLFAAPKLCVQRLCAFLIFHLCVRDLAVGVHRRPVTDKWHQSKESSGPAATMVSPPPKDKTEKGDGSGNNTPR